MVNCATFVISRKFEVVKNQVFNEIAGDSVKTEWCVNLNQSPLKCGKQSLLDCHDRSISLLSDW